MMQQLVLTFLGLYGCLPAKVLREYHYVDRSKTWAEAQSYCRAEFNDLATVDEKDDSERVRSLLRDRARDAWIGLYDEITRWTWSLGNEDFNVSADFGNWHNGEPNNRHSAHGCVVMHSNGYWHDIRCRSSRQAICFNEQGSPRYKIGKRMNWYEARTYCRSHYTDLAVIKTMEENKRIASKLSERAWVGLRRTPWSKWSDGTPRTFTKWEKGRPKSTLSPVTLCVMVNTTTGAWRDADCSERHSFICQDLYHPPVRRAAVFRMKLRSEANLADPDVQERILKQLHAKLETRQVPDFTLRWTRRNGETFHRESKKKKAPAC